MDLETGIVAHSEMVPWRNPNYAGADMNLGAWEIILILAGISCSLKRLVIGCKGCF